MATRIVYRDSGSGQFITKRDFDRRPQNTVERERVRIPIPSSSPKKSS